MERFENCVNIFKALGDMTRLRIVRSIFDEAKAVSVIANELEMTQSSVSHQLQVLKLYDIVKNERRGKEVYYYLSDSHVKTIVDQVFTHASHN